MYQHLKLIRYAKHNMTIFSDKTKHEINFFVFLALCNRVRGYAISLVKVYTQ